MDPSRPAPVGARTVGELSAQLRLLQTWSGLTYRDIHRRVVRSRQDRGIAEVPALNTIYRCLKPGRSRLDVELVVDIARSLLDDDAQAAEWRQAYQVVAGLAADAAVVTVTDQLPDDLDTFTGRAAEVAAAIGAVEDGAAGGHLLIDGMPGVGKTRLAVHLAHRLAGRGAELLLSVNLRGHDTTRRTIWRAGR